jgi:hypothetical protein
MKRDLLNILIVRDLKVKVLAAASISASPRESRRR